MELNNILKKYICENTYNEINEDSDIIINDCTNDSVFLTVKYTPVRYGNHEPDEKINISAMDLLLFTIANLVDDVVSKIVNNCVSSTTTFF